MDIRNLRKILWVLATDSPNLPMFSSTNVFHYIWYYSGVRKLHIAHELKGINYDEIPRLCQVFKGVQLIDQDKKIKLIIRHCLLITLSILRKIKKLDPNQVALGCQPWFLSIWRSKN